MQADPNSKETLIELQWALMESASHALLNMAIALVTDDLILAKACLSQVDDDVDQLKRLGEYRVII